MVGVPVPIAGTAHEPWLPLLGRRETDTAMGLATMTTIDTYSSVVKVIATVANSYVYIVICLYA